MNRCLHCGVPIRQVMKFSTFFVLQRDFLCGDCLKHLVPVVGGCCRCGKKTNDVICEDCLYWKSRGIKLTNYSMYYYNHFARALINQIKFMGDVKLLLAFKNKIHRFVKQKNFNQVSLVPVPLHQDRLLERGFNQSLYLAKLLPFQILDIMVKLNNEKQSKKSKMERMKFDVQYKLKNNAINLSNQKIMIVDDIYTTGATVHKIAKILVDKNVKEVISFTLFRS